MVKEYKGSVQISQEISHPLTIQFILTTLRKMASIQRRKVSRNPVIMERYDPEDDPQPLPIRDHDIFHANDSVLEKIAHCMEENLHTVRFQSPEHFVRTINGKREREDIRPVENI